MKRNLVLATLACALSACMTQSADESTKDVPATQQPAKGDELAFRLGAGTMEAVLKDCDSLEVISYQANGSVQKIKESILKTISDNTFRISGINPGESRSIEVFFITPDKTRKYRIFLQISVTANTPPIDAGVTLYPQNDATFDREGWNVGLGSDLRLFYDDALGLIDFGDLAKLLAGHKIKSAHLEAHAWADYRGGTHPDSMTIYAGTTQRGWQEGTGHWFYFDGKGVNDYETAYSNFPQYTPPAGTENPSFAAGVRWGNNPELLTNWSKISETKFGDLQVPVGRYPTLENTQPGVWDVTEALRTMLLTGSSKAFALRRAPVYGSDAMIGFYSKDHLDRTVYGPRLVVEFDDQAGEVTTEKSVVQDADIDQEDWNKGKGSDLRLAYGNAMALLDFGDLSSDLKQKELVKAEVVLHCWQGSVQDPGVPEPVRHFRIQWGPVSRDWSEGSGHWFFFDNRKVNGYETAYAQWPDWIPPVGTTNPSSAPGIRWSNSAAIRDSYQPLASMDIAVNPTIHGQFPTAAQTSEIHIDVTSAVKAMMVNKSFRAFGLKRIDISGSSLAEIVLDAYSKEQTPGLAPKLVLTTR